MLNRLFGSNEAIAKGAEIDEEVILRSWRDYLGTISMKQDIINGLPHKFGKRRQAIEELQPLLVLELADIRKAEDEEGDFIPNLQSLEHDKKIRRIHRLDDCLRYIETKHEYVYEMLRHLYATLISEANLLARLHDEGDLIKFRKLIRKLMSEFEVELDILEKIVTVESFREIFCALVNGEHTINKMGKGEKRLLKKMQKRLTKTFSSMAGRIVEHQITPNKKDKELIDKWAIDVFNRVEVRIFLGIMDDAFPGLHPDVGLEFVNRPEFITLVTKSVYDLQKEKVPDQMINVFVHSFREWYNHERD